MTEKRCRACGTVLVPGREFCPNCLIRVPADPPEKTRRIGYPKDTPENRARNMKEFRVIGMEEVWCLEGGKFDKMKMEDMLNSYGKEGWSVKAVATRQLPGFASLTNESIVILERDLPLVPG
jgi:hypothetical protein